MIVRILGEGQLSIDDPATAGLSDLDARLTPRSTPVRTCVRRALKAPIAGARAAGTPVPADSLEPSGLILPYEEADLAEVGG